MEKETKQVIVVGLGSAAFTAALAANEATDTIFYDPCKSVYLGQFYMLVTEIG